MPAAKWLLGRCSWEMPPGTTEDGKKKEWWKLGVYPSLGMRPRHSFPH